jgi:HprK-related kinase B
MLHSSAVTRGGTALAVIGQSGSGKSSVAVRLLEHGCDFMTNDRLIVEPTEGGVLGHGLPKLPRVNPGTLLAGTQTRALVDQADRARYARLSEEELWRLEEKYDLDIKRTLGRKWVLSAPLEAALVLEWQRGERPVHIERLNTGLAIESLRGAAKSFGPFDLSLSERTDAAFHTMAVQVPVYRVTGAADPSGLARRLASSDWSNLQT